ncbi:two-component system phosphate regulon sensor histidine kinase PhoR [Tenacibaculum adriaticum]|uniref:histidine kinase n=2 Tax=Tenacibaculum adriaticum TaxID=413713 RepID=A0A5S5DUB9_9FLAO|nr:two-component system phosphate regulon sensor histidine kinase PhoR [Tenacibaculum adriaticum]
MNEIQLSLDNAIEQYYVDLSKRSYFAIVEPKFPSKLNNTKKSNLFKKIFTSSSKKDTLHNNTLDVSGASLEITTDNKNELQEIDSVLSIVTKEVKKKLGSSATNSFNKIKALTQFSKEGKSGFHIQSEDIKEVKVFKGKKATDSLKLIKGLQTIFVAVQNDSLNHEKVDSILQKELTQKKINVSYAFKFFKNDTLHTWHNSLTTDKNLNEIESKSTFLGVGNRFEMLYTNPSAETLKRSSTGILLSLLLSIAVISSLFYLLKIINQQKQLAEIKNDLISNITHEFKTPITTVSTALEAINNFNVIEDKEKTQKYISISETQIKKLHLMVEKLLETATLDSEKLLLKKEDVNLTDLLDKLTKKHLLIAPEKTISFSSNFDELSIEVDEFHFENAISNLIDNAVKYGGGTIEISLLAEDNIIAISVSDNGNGIEKYQQEKIFGQFYRIPKGNTHDVKGFGIGLYYTKKIIEKHEGTISINSNPKKTTFKIKLPNV